MSENPLLEKVKLPGRVFQLPSRGMFYQNGELAPEIRDGEVHVHAMSAIDEINMKNPDQLFSGDAVNTVFARCVPGIKKPSELLSKDVDALMIYLRAVTYGPNYEFTARHTCKDAKDNGYIANVEELITRIKIIDPTVVESTYTVNLSNGQTVKLRPNKYQQVLDLIRSNENKKEFTSKDQEDNLMKALLGVVASVDGITDPKLIIEWVQNVPAPLITRIAERVEKLNDWGTKLDWKCACKQCGAEFNVDLPIDPISFFTE